MIQTAMSIILDGATISIGTLMYFWYLSVGKGDEGSDQLTMDLFIMLVSKTSPWLALPISLCKLYTGSKEVAKARWITPLPNRVEIAQLLWWSLGLELFGLISTLLDIIN